LRDLISRHYLILPFNVHFEVWRSKVKITKRPNDQISTLVGIFSPVPGMHGLILTKLITVTSYHIHKTLLTFSRVQRSRSRTIFYENALFWQRHRPTDCYSWRPSSYQHLLLPYYPSV